MGDIPCINRQHSLWHRFTNITRWTTTQKNASLLSLWTGSTISCSKPSAWKQHSNSPASKKKTTNIHCKLASNVEKLMNKESIFAPLLNSTFINNAWFWFIDIFQNIWPTFQPTFLQVSAPSTLLDAADSSRCPWEKQAVVRCSMADRMGPRWPNCSRNLCRRLAKS